MRPREATPAKVILAQIAVTEQRLKQISDLHQKEATERRVALTLRTQASEKKMPDWLAEWAAKNKQERLKNPPAPKKRVVAVSVDVAMEAPPEVKPDAKEEAGKRRWKSSVSKLRATKFLSESKQPSIKEEDEEVEDEDEDADEEDAEDDVDDEDEHHYTRRVGRRDSNYDRRSLLPMAPPLPEAERVKALEGFKRMCDEEDMLSCEDAVEVLKDIGYSHPDPEVVNYIVEQMFGGRSFLEQAEWLEFVPAYHFRYWGNIQEQFNAIDRDGRESISSKDIAPFLKNVGITPIPRVINDLLAEITGSATGDGTEQVRVLEFVKLLDIIADRSGFTRSEYKVLMALFSRHGNREQDTVDVEHMFTILDKLGLMLNHATIQAIVTDVHEDEAGSLTEHEYLHVVRKCFEHELTTIHEAFRLQDPDMRGSVSTDSLPSIFLSLGFMAASPSLISEIMAATRMTSQQHGVMHPDFILFEDVVLLIDEYRDTEGFLAVERQEVKNVYDVFRERLTHPEGISVLDALQAVRWFGYPATYDSMFSALLQHDLGIGEEFELKDFLKLLGIFRTAEVKYLRELFAPSSSQVPVADLRTALTKIGYSTQGNDMGEFMQKSSGTLSSVDVSLWEMDQLALEFRHASREHLRANHGFSFTEVQRLNALFDKGAEECDHDDHSHADAGPMNRALSHTLSRKPLRHIVEDFLPNVGTDEAEHDLAARILQQGGKTVHELDFNEFLCMMRVIQEHRQKKQVEIDRTTFMKERNARTASRFSAEEVKAFKEVFDMHDADHSGDIDSFEFEALFSTTLHVEADSLHQDVNNLIRSVDEDHNRVLDFPEFLMVMRKVLDEDWHGLAHLKAAAQRVRSNTISTSSFGLPQVQR